MKIANVLLKIVCIAFVATIALPMVVSLVKEDKAVSNIEKRSLQTWPSFSDTPTLRDYFSSINDYVNDHFGFRENLIELNNQFKYALNESPVKTVIRGKNDWWFYKIRDPLVSNYVNSKEGIKNNLTARANYIKRRYAELKHKGIVYQHIVVPNKMNLYPEYLPNVYALTDINATYDFFKQQLLDIDNSVAFDAIDVLETYKKNEFDFDLYNKNDTHWNPYGAYIVANEAINRLMTEHLDLNFNAKIHTFETHTKISGDLAVFIGLSTKLKSQEPVTQNESCTESSNIKWIQEKFAMLSCNENETRILLIADSFIDAIYPYFGEAVGTLYMADQKTSRADIARFTDSIKPDVVIEVLVERSLARSMN